MGQITTNGMIGKGAGLLSPIYGANKNKFYKYSYFSIRYIIKPIIT